jgi:hypothetical protein
LKKLEYFVKNIVTVILLLAMIFVVSLGVQGVKLGIRNGDAAWIVVGAVVIVMAIILAFILIRPLSNPVI